MIKKVLLTILTCLISVAVCVAQENQNDTKLLPKPVCLDGKTVYINENGRVVLKTDFDYGWSDSNSFSEGLAAFKENGKYGFIDETGKIVIKPSLDYVVAGFSEGLALIKIDSKYGFINRTGKIVVQPQYDKARNFENGLALVAVENGRDKSDFFELIVGTIINEYTIAFNYGFIDKTGNIKVGKGKEKLKGKFDEARQFSEGLAVVRIGSKWGYVNDKDEIVIKRQFKRAESFSEGLAPASVDGRTWGFIDKTGKFVITPQFTRAEGFSEGLAAVSNSKSFDIWGFIDKSGNVVINYNFFSAGDFYNGTAIVRFPDTEGFGRIDRMGKAISATRFDSASNFVNGVAWVYPRIYGENGIRYGGDYIDKTGRYIWNAKEKNERYGKKCND